MGLITRCPACGTLFKVVPDQLRISEGWVRCGHCAEIFDASAHLQTAAGASASDPMPDSAAMPLAQGVPQPEPQPETLSQDEAGESSAPQPAPEPAPESSLETSFESSLHSQMDDSGAASEPDSEQLDAEAKALVEDPLDRPFELRRQDLSPEADSMLDEAPPSAPASETDSELEDLTFVRQARRQARWQRPLVRGLLALALVALGLLLVAQVAVHDRDRLTAAEPALRPWLAGLCAALDCRVGPPRQIDQIAIDSSAFNKLRADLFRLQVTLKNQGPLEVAMPALELTLTDSQDQPVIRRVLLPAELGARRAALAAATEWSGAVAFSVEDNSLGSRIAGYRLLAFYP
jgi:predicted Zn finger-like uncharacterized protein